MSEYRKICRSRRRAPARARLLATTGLAALMLASFAIHSGPARAAITVTPGGSVTVTSNTATTATTNTDGAISSSSDRIQLWNDGTPITATTGNFSISGNGLALEETGSTPATINMTANGPIRSTASGGIGLLLSGNGGDITFTGSASLFGSTAMQVTNLSSGKITFISSSLIFGQVYDGIDTSAVDGDTLVTVNGSTTKGSTGYAGIRATATGAGNLDVEINSGTVGSTASIGVVLSQTGTGSNTINNSATISSAGTAASPAIEIATTNAGSTTITNNAGGTILSGSNTNSSPVLAGGLAILSTVTTGADTIVNAGHLYGEIYLSDQTNSLTNSGTWYADDNTGTGYNAAAFGSSGHNSLINSGTINAGDSNTTATATFTGVNIIDNSGTINAGLHGVGDVTSFIAGGATTQTVTNSGMFRVRGTLNFEGDATFTNTGMIEMRVQNYYTGANPVTDVTALNIAVSGNSYTPASAAYDFIGGTGSELGLDAAVGADPSAGSSVPSDRLLIGGAANGTTAILLNDTGTATAVSYNPTGITLVAVNGASTNAFYLQSLTSPPSGDIFQPARGPLGSIKKGMWFFPLLQTSHAVAAADGLTGADSSEYRLYGLPDIEAFQTPMAITGAEDIWYDTALGWNQRQDQLRKHWTGVYGSANAYADGKFNFWAKATGSWDTRKDSSSLDTYSPVPGLFGTVDTGFKQNTYLAQVGSDVGFNGVLGRNGVLVLDASVGLIDSTLKFRGSSNEFDYTGGTISGSVDYLNGGWFWDTLLKADVLQAKLKYNSLAYFGNSQQSVEADTWGVMSSTGYHFDLAGGAKASAFLEPLLTIAYTSTTLGGFESMGTAVTFNDSDTVRGAVGAKLGTRLSDNNGTVVDASITGNYWDEFTNSNGVTFPAVAPSSPLILSDVREKGYGEVTGLLNIANGGKGWSAFLDAGGKFNSQYTSIEASGGIAYRW